MDKYMYKILIIWGAVFCFVMELVKQNKESTFYSVLLIAMTILLILSGIVYVLSYLLFPLKYLYWKFMTPSRIIKKLQKGYDINKADEDGITPFVYACMHNKNPEVIKILINSGANLNKRNKDDYPILFDFISNKKVNIEIIKMFIEKGGNVNIKDYTGWTPLIYACVNNLRIEIINVLIELGADVNLKDKKGMNVLMYACKYSKNPQVIYLLLENGAKICLKDEKEKSALDYALKNSYLKSSTVINRLKF